MHVILEDLFSFHNLANYDPYYCFDRKTYEICHASLLRKNDTEPFVRYVLMMQVDEEQMQLDFVTSFHNRILLKDFGHVPGGFFHFCEKHDLLRLWRDYHCAEVGKLAIAWCNEYKIKYKGGRELYNDDGTLITLEHDIPLNDEERERTRVIWERCRNQELQEVTDE